LRNESRNKKAQEIARLSEKEIDTQKQKKRKRRSEGTRVRKDSVLSAIQRK